MNISPSQVVAVHDCSSIYRVPLLLQEQEVLEFFLKRLEIPKTVTQHNSDGFLRKWRNLADRCAVTSPFVLFKGNVMSLIYL